MTITTVVHALLRERSVGRCEMCGGPATNTHHRRPRGMGGSKDPATNTPANLVRVCGSGSTGCHGWIESNREAARDCGYLVGQGHDPATVPVLLMTSGGLFEWVLLDADGGYTTCCACGTTLAGDLATPALAHLRLYRERQRAFVCRLAIPVDPGTAAADVLVLADQLGVEPGTSVQVEIRHAGEPASTALITATAASRDVEGWLPDLRDDAAVARLRRLA